MLAELVGHEESRVDLRSFQKIFKMIWTSPTRLGWAALFIRFSNVLFVWGLLVRTFSAAEIAVWGVFSVITNFQVIVDSAFSDTFSRSIAYMNEESGRSSKLGPMIGTMKRIYGSLSLVFCISLIFIGTLFVKRPISEVEFEVGHVWLAWAITIFGCSFSIFGNQYIVLLTGMQELAVLKRVEVLTAVGSMLSSLVVLAFDGRLLSYVLAQQVWLIVFYLLLKILCQKKSPAWMRNEKNFSYDHKVFLNLWPAAWRSWLGTILSFGSFQASGLVYAQYGSMAQVGSYLLGLRVIQMIYAVALVPFQMRLPQLANLYAKGHRSSVIATAEQGMRRTYICYAVLFLLAGTLGRPILAVIKANTTFVDPRIWSLIGIAYYLERYGGMHMQIYTLTNKVIWHIANGIHGVIFVCLSIFLFPKMQVIAFPLSLVLANLLFFVQ